MPSQIEDHAGVLATPVLPWQPTACFHDDHHRYFHCNFGQHVLWFDRLFGTLRRTSQRYGEGVFGGRGAARERKQKPA